MSAKQKIVDLRREVRAIEGRDFEAAKTGVLPFRDARLNALFPLAGLPLGALHEITASGIEAELSAPAAAFAACLAGRIARQSGGFVLWAMRRPDCYGPGLIPFGLDPGRVLWVACRKDAEILGAMEEALHSRALSVVLGEPWNAGLKAGLRLAAAARAAGVTAFLLRRPLFSSANAERAGAVASRWAVRAVPGQTEEPGLAPPRWRLELEYCRNGRPAAFIVEASHGENDGAAGHVRVVAELRDDESAFATATARGAA
jgi:hypothetical protein